MKLKKLLFDGETIRLMGITALIKPAALLTQMAIAKFFGASAEMDAYAFSLFLVTFLGFTIGRVFSTVVIPQITKLRKTMAETEVAAYQNAVVVLYFLPVMLILVGLLLRSDLAIDLIGSKLPDETKEYAYQIVRFMAIPAMLFVVVKLSVALLNLNKQFKVAAIMPPLHTALFLVLLLFLHNHFGIWALPVSWAISYTIQAAIILSQVFRTGVVKLVRPSLPKGGMATLWSLSWVVLVSQALLMVNTFVDKWFAASLPVGSISYVLYSHGIINFGHQLFSLSLIVVMFTKMSEYLAAADLKGCDLYISNNLMKMSNLVVPAAVGLFVVSPEVVRVLYQRGAFDEVAALNTSQTLGMYLLGLPAIVINGLIARVFHSLQKVRERVWLALQYILTNVVGNILLVKVLATVGLAISSTVAINLHLMLSFLFIHRFNNGLRTGTYLAIILRAYFMAAIAWLVYYSTGVGALLEELIAGDGLVWIILLGAAKFSFIICTYGVQLMIWMKVRHRK